MPHTHREGEFRPCRHPEHGSPLSRLRGQRARNRGNDTIDGRGGNDFIAGGAGSDLLVGGPGSDETHGEDDPGGVSTGPAGADVLLGGPGDDILDGQQGSDSVSGGGGGGGADTIEAHDGQTDTVSCGDGPDTAHLDPNRLDRTDRTCETVTTA